MISKTIFVAGGTGFLGKSLIKKLQKKKKFNIITTSLSLGTDFRDFNQTLEYFKKNKPDIAIHSAAYIGGIKFGLDHAGEVYFNNILISTNLIEAARLTGTELFISPIANCAYPDVVNKDFKETEFWNGALHPSVMVYGMVRKAQWSQTWAYTKQYGMKFINLVLPNMYGPGDYFDAERSHALGALLMKITNAKKKNLPEVVVWGTGKPVREWLYVDDGAEALIRALDINYYVDPINIGIGRGISIKYLAQLIKRIVGYKGKLIFDKTKPDGAPYKVMDVSLCRKIFRWLPKTELTEGVEKTYKWYLSNQ
ncbi:GDP-L-fucose synthetase [Candidatus Roizmanbacteria bacterium RIFCSPHIGHO2_12_FULL_33_9]|uniref:GDP-L-fucose synthase n=1 Tax=Candidatus Roizmanbacteria bacterium RIFCSPHIGHO2_12_FULL_33_9 TaxID=1802045 RepID=A0A1F7HHM3_9BACT|nr:MAG: GDP-L-fucose synthetase [Candidatus Roizmanbacteria bacterium RIFCSPHIGHO2_12_FULL_33_9]